MLQLSILTITNVNVIYPGMEEQVGQTQQLSARPTLSEKSTIQYISLSMCVTGQTGNFKYT